MNKTILSILLAYLFFSCQQNSKVENKETQSWQDSLNVELDRIYLGNAIVGYGVALVNEKGTIYENAFGYADLKQKKAYTVNTIQNIASVSKTLLGVALLKAQELGLLKLDEPANKYLPFKVYNPHYPDEIITIRHLATHTSTIIDTDFYGGKAYILKNAQDTTLVKSLENSESFNTQEANMSIGDFLQNYLTPNGEWYLEEEFLKKKPGELYEYTNVGATLAAYILEITANQSYSDFTKKNILNPLEMSASGWSFSGVDLAKHTKLYADLETELPFYSLITYPDGGLITSVSDMGKYLSELIKGYNGEGTLLTKESYNELFKEQLTAENFEERDTDRDFDDEYNAGLFIGFTPIGYIGHMGGDPGVSTFMFFNPKTKIGRLLFVNTALNEKGVKQFYDTWNKLGEFEQKLSDTSNQ